MHLLCHVAATSNTVQTIVQQVGSFTLNMADDTRYVAPGGQVVYPHTLTNTGNGSDTITLSAANNNALGDAAILNLTFHPVFGLAGGIGSKLCSMNAISASQLSKHR
jgi:galactose mutarotase-like enzyme